MIKYPIIKKENKNEKIQKNQIKELSNFLKNNGVIT